MQHLRITSLCKLAHDSSRPAHPASRFRTRLHLPSIAPICSLALTDSLLNSPRSNGIFTTFQQTAATAPAICALETLLLIPKRLAHNRLTMGLEKFNPFKKDRQNFPGVVIPLSSAPAHSHPNADTEKKIDPSTEALKSLERAPSSEDGSAGSLPDTSHLTIESLRAEIDADVVASGHDSVYDRMCPLPVYSSVSFQKRQCLLCPPRWNCCECSCR